MATHFARAPTKGLAATKATLYASPANTLQQLDLERHDARWATARLPRGRGAFMEKRAPQFTGMT
jgi:2-(1,2-epoxy-1,2-dihydrophenyl)acetyl-CoA isomerase